MFCYFFIFTLRWVFSDTTPYNELGSASTFITAHRFSAELKYLEEHGKFNVQYQAFRNNKHGRSCLEKWRNQCLDWCYDRLEVHRFADQKYLDNWPELYDGHLVISSHPGVGAAPWNVGNSGFEYSEHDSRVSGEQLIFYHFQGLKFLSRHLIKAGLANYNVSALPDLKSLYVYYAGKLVEAGTIAGDVCPADIRSGYSKLRAFINATRPFDLMLV